MKQRKLAPLLAVSLSLQMVVSPVMGIAAEEKKTSASDVILGTSEAFATSIQAAGQIWSTVNQIRSGGSTGLSGQAAFDMQKLQEQQTPQPDKYFSMQRLGAMPGMTEYLAMNNINPAMLECKTLPTTLHEAKNEVCTLGVTTDRGVAPAAQLSEMQAYANQYFQINKMYRNYSADSNSAGQLFGVGCMKNAMNILNGFFKYRLDELDKLTTNLEAMQNQFREASRSDLDAIEESVAVLEGGDSELANKVKSKKPDLFDFGKRFENPACTSMFAKDTFNQIGRGKGLNAINQQLKTSMSEKPPGSKYSGESYSNSHSAVVEDLNNLADKVAKQSELRFSELADEKGYTGFLRSLSGSVSSTNGANNLLTSDLFSDVQTSFTEKSQKLQNDFNTIASELSAGGANPARALSIVRNLTTTNFDSEVSTIENQLKNGCLKSNLSGNSSLDSLLEKIYDPTSSNFANKNASNFLKDKIKTIMENDKTSPEKKLSELKALESSQGNRYYVKMDNSYEVQETDANGNIVKRIVDASTRKSPSVFFSDIIRNCEAQFKVNKLDNQLSGAEAIQKLRALHSSYKNLAKSHASEMKASIKKKLIECESPEDANSSAIGSCTSERFNTTAPGFCANAALSCSKNMQACTQQAEKYVSEIKAQKTARVNNYKALVEKNKKDIVKIFDSALARYMKDGEILRGMFGAGFSSPSGIEREVPEGSRYLNLFTEATSGSPDGRLLLEDPDKYVEMFKKNITALKKSVEDQQNQIVGGGLGKNNGLLAEHIKQTEKNYREVASSAEKFADKCDRNYSEYVKASEQQRNQQNAENQKLQSELGEKLPRFCKKYQTAQSNAQGACKGELTDLFDSAMKAANRSGTTSYSDGQAIAEFREICDGFNNESDTSSTLSVDTQTMCTKLGVKDGKFEDADCQLLLKGTLEERKNSPFCVTSTVSNGTNTTTGTPDCKQLVEQISARYTSKYPLGGASGTVTVTSSAPSFCTAGDNSDRGNVFQKGLDVFRQELEKSRAAKQ
ncbi:hypothetical protein ACJVC5_10255 [Peredibacter sp. HCB2-198]|uniref:hypothetical protein n=1 Tax=Peredibacter sp. HCB2-198 TaxID=3383025 RepID=UPI0038B44AA6